MAGGWLFHGHRELFLPCFLTKREFGLYVAAQAFWCIFGLAASDFGGISIFSERTVLNCTDFDVSKKAALFFSLYEKTSTISLRGPFEILKALLPDHRAHPDANRLCLLVKVREKKKGQKRQRNWPDSDAIIEPLPCEAEATNVFCLPPTIRHGRSTRQ
jgi:hypothetical protein